MDVFAFKDGVIKALNKADYIVTGGAPKQVANYIEKGAKKAAVNANKSATDKSTLLGRAVGSIKKSKVGKTMIPEEGFARKVYALGESDIAELQASKLKLKESLANAGDTIDEATRKATSEKIARIEELLTKGTYTGRDSLGNLAAKYYGDSTYGANRLLGTEIIGETATVGTLLGTRFLTGGDLTHNGKGERDIVGIPFI